MFKLSKYFLIALFNNWLTLDEICSLDTATTNAEIRMKLFLNLFSSPEFVANREFNGRFSVTFINWVILRGISVSTLNLQGLYICDVGGVILEQSTFSRALSFLFGSKTVQHQETSDASFNMLVERITRLSHLKLKSLNFANNLDLSVSHMKVFVPATNNLTEINFRKCTQLTDDCLRHLASHCSSLVCFNISHCKQITSTTSEGGLGRLIQSNSQLTSLNLYNCRAISPIILQTIAFYCGNYLRYFDFGMKKVSYLEEAEQNNNNFTQQSQQSNEENVGYFLDFVSKCTQLVQFSVNNQHSVTDKVLETLLQHNSNLTQLDLLDIVLSADTFTPLIPQLRDIVQLSLFSFQSEPASGLGFGFSSNLKYDKYCKMVEAVGQTCKQLQILKVNLCFINGKIVTAIATTCVSLTVLEYQSSGTSTFAELCNEELILLCSKNPQLHTLCLPSNYSMLNNAALYRMLAGLKHLRKLAMNSTATKTVHTEANIITNNNTLSTLDIITERCADTLEYLVLLHDHSAEEYSYTRFARHCINITKLDLGMCEKITDKVIVSIAQNFKQLRSITLFGDLLTDNCIEVLCRERFSTLTSIKLFRWLPLITEKSILSIAKYCYKLEKFRINMLSGLRMSKSTAFLVTKSALKSLVDNCIYLRIIRVIGKGLLDFYGVAYALKHLKYLTSFEITDEHSMVDAKLREKDFMKG